MKNLVIIAIILLGVVLFFKQNAQYKVLSVGSSVMEDTLKMNSEVMVKEFSSEEKMQISRGSIVAYELQDGNEFDVRGGVYFGRIIGVAGDKIKIESSIVYVNNVKVDEPYVKEGQFSNHTLSETVVPENSYFIMVDNRNFVPTITRIILAEKIVGQVKK